MYLEQSLKSGIEHVPQDYRLPRLMARRAGHLPLRREQNLTKGKSDLKMVRRVSSGTPGGLLSHPTRERQDSLLFPKELEVAGNSMLGRLSDRLERHK